MELAARRMFWVYMQRHEIKRVSCIHVSMHSGECISPGYADHEHKRVHATMQVYSWYKLQTAVPVILRLGWAFLARDAARVRRIVKGSYLSGPFLV